MPIPACPADKGFSDLLGWTMKGAWGASAAAREGLHWAPARRSRAWLSSCGNRPGSAPGPTAVPSPLPVTNCRPAGPAGRHHRRRRRRGRAVRRGGGAAQEVGVQGGGAAWIGRALWSGWGWGSDRHVPPPPPPPAHRPERSPRISTSTESTTPHTPTPHAGGGQGAARVPGAPAPQVRRGGGGGRRGGVRGLAQPAHRAAVLPPG